MPIFANLEDYHKSIGSEFKILENRIRYLIGDAHWQTDGEHKEAVLRRIMRGFLPETKWIGKGFVCFDDGFATNQIDVLVAEKTKPTLFRDGDLLIVTPDVASHVIEVKTRLDYGNQTSDVIETLANNAERIRNNTNNNSACWVGLFAYDANPSAIDQILELLALHARGDVNRVINCVALGTNCLVRYWHDNQISEDGRPLGAGWGLYYIKDFAFPYFISNAVWPTDDEGPARFAWFPIEGGKQQFRRSFQLLR